MPGIVNYFIGNNPAKWHTNIETFGKVRYSELYPGIDLVYYGNPRQLEHDFVVEPGADPSTIRWRFDGATAVHLTENGTLAVAANGQEVWLQAPVVYQEKNEIREPIQGRYPHPPQGC